METRPSFGAIFDWDGVIVDSSAHHERSWELLAEEQGRTLPPDHFKRGFGRKNERIIPGILHWTTDPAEIHRLSLRKEALYRAVMREDGLTMLPGVVELLCALHGRGIPCAVGSSTHRANLDVAFGILGIRRYFNAVVSGEDVSHGKPDPEVFLIAAERIGMAPESCVVFEDVPAGIEAARRAGMRTVALTTTNASELLADADLVVRDLSDVDYACLAELFTGKAGGCSVRKGTQVGDEG
ncbi:MAG: HAD-IA family hydrolase [Chitinivibrionales bacterium]|nr:HAD-IA family hydrolase [Chitinivibrionales bacterium]